jgi:Ca-activated chloride channel family protein
MMKRLLILILLANITLFAMSKKVNKSAIDDWEYNSTIETRDGTRTMPTMGNMGAKGGVVAMSAPTPKAFRSVKKVGMAVGGAKDTNNFKANIDKGYLPKLDSITYEGQFYNHYFDTGLNSDGCKALFCPSYSSAKRLNSFSNNDEFFLSVGLNSGIEEGNFKRKKLNLVVVLDISGSMGSAFDEYHYDNMGNKVRNKDKSHKKKMQIATESIVAMLSHLKDDDRLGVALFDHGAYKAKPLNLVGDSNKEAIRDHILALTERGGTNWSAGYKEGVSLFEGINTSDPLYENRIIFLTDAMPNTGELSKNKLFGLAKNASERNIHTTFVGVGVDFNNDLVEYVSKTKGANYFSVHSSSEFSKLLDKEFEYMVTPLVYDLELKLDSSNYSIEAVYGSPDASMATGQIMKVNTLFPSHNDGTATKGGVVLLKLKRVGSGKDDIKLNVSYEDVNGKAFSNEQKIAFKSGESYYYDNSGIQKAILLSDYVSVMKNWIMETRAGCNDDVKWMMESAPSIMKRVTEYPPKHPLYPVVPTWEKKSCKLKVSSGYKKLFQVFKKVYINEMNSMGDESLNLELNILNTLIGQATSEITPIKKSKDDWQFKN